MLVAALSIAPSRVRAIRVKNSASTVVLVNSGEPKDQLSHTTTTSAGAATMPIGLCGSKDSSASPSDRQLRQTPLLRPSPGRKNPAVGIKISEGAFNVSESRHRVFPTVGFYICGLDYRRSSI